MRIRSLEELRTADEGALRFSPLGLGPAIPAESAAKWQQQAIADADLSEVVPESTRRTYERLRNVHAYGVLSYEMFTVASDLSLFVIEQALTERFMAHYQGAIPFVRRDGTRTVLRATQFTDVYDALRKRGGSLYRGGWSLELPSVSSKMPFGASMRDLFTWARRQRFLHGQRNRRLEQVLIDLRNMAAHPRSYHLGDPVESARSIHDTAEIINRLWGVLTPGGRLYPAPVRREVIAIGWNAEATSGVILLPDQLRAGQLEPGWTCVLVRAVDRDGALWWYRSRQEVTPLPTEWLWGPGSGEDAIAWLDDARPEADEVEYLDRWFVVRRVGDDRIDIPQRPEVVAGLDASSRKGEWCLVRADYPGDAGAHVRGVVAGDSACSPTGPCPRCAADMARRGPWVDIVDELARGGVSVAAVRVPDARVPLHDLG